MPWHANLTLSVTKHSLMQPAAPGFPWTFPAWMHSLMRRALSELIAQMRSLANVPVRSRRCPSPRQYCSAMERGRLPQAVRKL
jgi:hypothetical protein